MKKIFVIGLGGRVEQANIEVHDVQVVVAEAMEDTYDVLMKNWYGDTLHLDEYKVLEGADGYRFELSDQPQETTLKLFFVNMGGYDTNHFGELHRFSFYVTETENEAKAKSHEKLLPNTFQKHVDNIHEVKNNLKFADGNECFIHFIPSVENFDMKPDWSGYKKLRSNI